MWIRLAISIQCNADVIYAVLVSAGRISIDCVQVSSFIRSALATSSISSVLTLPPSSSNSRGLCSLGEFHDRDSILGRVGLALRMSSVRRLLSLAISQPAHLPTPSYGLATLIQGLDEVVTFQSTRHFLRLVCSSLGTRLLPLYRSGIYNTGVASS